MAPNLTESAPVNGQKDVAINPPILLSFNSLDPNTATNNNIILVPIRYQGDPENIDVVPNQEDDGTWKVEIYPESTLLENTQYKIIIKTGLADSSGDTLGVDKVVYFETGTKIESGGKVIESPWDAAGFPFEFTEKEEEKPETNLVSTSPKTGTYNLQLRPDMGWDVIPDIKFTFNKSLNGETLDSSNFTVTMDPVDGDPLLIESSPSISEVTLSEDGKTVTLSFETKERKLQVTNWDCDKEPLTANTPWFENQLVSITLDKNFEFSDSTVPEREESIVFTTAYLPLWARMAWIKRKFKVFVRKLELTDEELLLAIFMESRHLLQCLWESGCVKKGVYPCPTKVMIGWVECAVARRLIEEVVLSDYVTGNRANEKALSDFRVGFAEAPRSGPISKVLTNALEGNEKCLRANWISLFGTGSTFAVQGINSFYPQRIYTFDKFSRADSPAARRRVPYARTYPYW